MQSYHVAVTLGLARSLVISRKTVYRLLEGHRLFSYVVFTFVGAYGGLCRRDLTRRLLLLSAALVSAFLQAKLLDMQLQVHVESQVFEIMNLLLHLLLWQGVVAA